MAMTFGLDFDDTFTACPELWSRFVTDCENQCFRVILVTARRETDENVKNIRECLKLHGCLLPIVFSNLGSKLDAVAKRGIKVDIWIDDDPEKLVRGH